MGRQVAEDGEKSEAPSHSLPAPLPSPTKGQMMGPLTAQSINFGEIHEQDKNGRE